LISLQNVNCSGKVQLCELKNRERNCSNQKCESLGKELGITTIYSEQLPEHKLEIIDQLVDNAPTAMVGDGINDAPALTKADVGISLSNATQIAVQSAQIILLNHKDFSQVYEAYLISKHTLKTIKQNLFWALIYNAIGIPIAAGLLYPFTGWTLSPALAGGRR